MIEVVQGSPYAFRHDGEGHDPTDQHYSDDWISVMKLVRDEYLPLRRFSSRDDAFAYVQNAIEGGADVSQRGQSKKQERLSARRSGETPLQCRQRRVWPPSVVPCKLRPSAGLAQQFIEVANDRRDTE